MPEHSREKTGIDKIKKPIPTIRDELHYEIPKKYCITFELSGGVSRPLE